MLIASSKEYFATSLGPNFLEGKEDEFTLDDMDGETVKAIVEFCYTGCIDLPEENVKKFLAIASGVQLDLLEEKCWRLLDAQLNGTNSLGTFVTADKFGNAMLRQRAFDFMCESLQMVPATDIHQLEHRLLEEILKSDKIQVTEECVFRRLLEWFEDKETEREQHMPTMLRLIRLEHFPSQVGFVYRFNVICLKTAAVISCHC